MRQLRAKLDEPYKQTPHPHGARGPAITSAKRKSNHFAFRLPPSAFMNTRSITFRLAAWCAGISLLVCIGFGLYTYLGFTGSTCADRKPTRCNAVPLQVAAIVNAHVEREGDAFTIDLIKTSYAPEHNDRFIRIRRPDGSLLYISGQPTDKIIRPRCHRARCRWPEGRGRKPRCPPPRAISSWCRPARKLPVAATSSTAAHRSCPGERVTARLPGRARLWPAADGRSSPSRARLPLVRRALTPVREITDALAVRSRATTLDAACRSFAPTMNWRVLSVVLNQMIGRLDEAFPALAPFHGGRFPRTPHAADHHARGTLESVSQEAGLDPANARERLPACSKKPNASPRRSKVSLLSRAWKRGEALMDVTRFDLGELVVSTAEQMLLLADEKHLAVRSQASARPWKWQGTVSGSNR